MEHPHTKKKSFSHIMRALHRDVAFITIGFTIVYALSGMLLVYRNTDFLKYEKQFENTLTTGITAENLAGELKIRNLKVEKEADGILYFKDGIYNSQTGKAEYSKKVYPTFIDKMVSLHKINGNNKMHWLSTAYGGLLFFLAFSSLFMYKKGTRLRRRSIITISLSVVIIVAVILAV